MFWKLQKCGNNLQKFQNASASLKTPEHHLVGILTLPLEHSHSPMAQTNFWRCSQTSAFVRMSATMSPVGTYCMIASPFVTRSSWTWWYFYWICLVRAWNCGSWDRMMAAWLSQWSVVGPFCGCPISSKNVWSHARCCPVRLSSMYSDSVVERATILCCLLDQEMALRLLRNRYPKVERELSGFCDHPASEYPWKFISMETSFLSYWSSMSVVAHR